MKKKYTIAINAEAPIARATPKVLKTIYNNDL